MRAAWRESMSDKGFIPQIYTGFWFDIQGTNVTLKGNTEPNWGWVDGHGQQVCLFWSV